MADESSVTKQHKPVVIFERIYLAAVEFRLCISVIVFKKNMSKQVLK